MMQLKLGVISQTNIRAQACLHDDNLKDSLSCHHPGILVEINKNFITFDIILSSL